MPPKFKKFVKKSTPVYKTSALSTEVTSASYLNCSIPPFPQSV